MAAFGGFVSGDDDVIFLEQKFESHGERFLGDAGEEGEFAEGRGSGAEDAEWVGGDGEGERGVGFEVEGEGEEDAGEERGERERVERSARFLSAARGDAVE